MKNLRICCQIILQYMLVFIMKYSFSILQIKSKNILLFFNMFPYLCSNTFQNFLWIFSSLLDIYQKYRYFLFVFNTSVLGMKYTTQLFWKYFSIFFWNFIIGITLNFCSGILSIFSLNFQFSIFSTNYSLIFRINLKMFNNIV